MPGKRNRQTFINDFNEVKESWNDIQRLLMEARKESLLLEKEAMKNPEGADFLENLKKADEPYLKIYEKYRETIWIQYEDLYRGPAKYDKDAVLDWIQRNTVIIALLSDTNFRESLVDMDRSFNYATSAAYRPHSLCQMAKGWINAFKTEADIKKAIAEDGTEIDLKKLEADNPKNSDLAFALEAAAAAFEKIEEDKKPDPAECASGMELFATDYSADKMSFSKFSKQLSDAMTSGDSDEYKKIIDAVKTFGRLDKIDNLLDKNMAAGLKKLNPIQQQAFKMFLVKEKINKYIAHKAKDGIKENALAKIDLVEKLDKYVCDRIRELNPDPFEFGEGKKYDPTDVKEAALNDLNESTAYYYHRSYRNMVKYINDLAVDVAPFCSDGKLNLDESESIMQKMIDGGYLIYDGKIVPPGTSPKELVDSVQNWDAHEWKKGSSTKPYGNPHSWLCVLNPQKNEYFPLSVQPGALQPKQDSEELKRLTIKNGNVWNNLWTIKNMVYDLNVDLTSTEKPWSTNGDEYRKVVENLEILDKKLKDMNVFSLHIDQSREHNQLFAKDYSYESLANEFNDTMTAIGNYMDAHKNINLNPRQIERLEKMNEIQSIYESIKYAGAKNLREDNARVQEHFKMQKFIDNLCMEKMKGLGKKLYRAALTDRAFFKTIRNGVMKNETFRKDFIELGLDGMQKMSKETLSEKDYFSDINISEIDAFRLERESRANEKESDELKYELEASNIVDMNFSSDEEKVLEAFALDNNSNYLGSGNDGSMTGNDYKKAAHQFFRQVKSGDIQVFGRDGKPAQLANALTVLADKISHPDNRPAFFRYDPLKHGYVGKEFVFGSDKDIDMAQIVFKDNPDKSITQDYIYICDKVIQQIGDMRKELNAASSFKHSKEHNEMSEALDNIYKDFRKIDLSACDMLQLRDAFSKLNEKAVNYISSHYKDNINDKQFDRLVVAQKIISINESISEPGIKYEDYLKQQYAKKGMLDLARHSRQLAKKNPDKTIQKTNSEYMTDITRTGDVKNKNSLGERYSNLDPKGFMDSAEFKKRVEGKKVTELESLLRESPRVTVACLKLDTKNAYYSQIERHDVPEKLKPKYEDELDTDDIKPVYSDDFYKLK